MQDKYEIFAEKGLTNIFDGALIPNLNKQTNQINNCRVIGYRLESIKSEKVQVNCRMPEDANGVYAATVIFDGIRRRGKNKTSVFFPKHWTKDEVTDAIFEAYQNKSVKNPSDNQYIGTSKKGMHVILWLDETGKVQDAMPFRDVVIELNRRRRARKHCGICDQPKHYVCFEHYNFKKTEIRKFFEKPSKQIRYFSRKIYFSVAKKLGLEK
jgi:ribosomal protein L34E